MVNAICNICIRYSSFVWPRRPHMAAPPMTCIRMNCLECEERIQYNKKVYAHFEKQANRNIHKAEMVAAAEISKHTKLKSGYSKYTGKSNKSNKSNQLHPPLQSMKKKILIPSKSPAAPPVLNLTPLRAGLVLEIPRSASTPH